MICVVNSLTFDEVVKACAIFPHSKLTNYPGLGQSFADVMS